MKLKGKLATGSAYGNKSMDGTMFGIGYHNAMDNGVFFRFEGSRWFWNISQHLQQIQTEKLH